MMPGDVKGTYRIVETRAHFNGSALRVSCVHCPYERWMRAYMFTRDPHTSHRGCLRTDVPGIAKPRLALTKDRYPIDSVHAIWRVASIDSAHDRIMALAVCVHCGYTQHIRPDVLKSRPTHIGCPVAPSSKNFTKRTTRDTTTPSGDSPKWAQWSAMLHMNDPECAGWTVGRIENVKAWRSNQLSASRRVSLEEHVSMRSDARSVIP